MGKTKRGKGTKVMAISDRSGLPIALHVTSAAPHEVTLVERTIQERFLDDKPQRLIGDKAFDSDPLDARLKPEGIEMIAPHKKNRVSPVTQDGRKLRRFNRRWKIERLFAWIYNYRRCVVRYEFHFENFTAFIQLACIMILLRYL